jgi:2-polyprenyl-3-methyl-5-hydroxy-6-metoxy-1,4-benzoquinol methylase
MNLLPVFRSALKKGLTQSVKVAGSRLRHYVRSGYVHTSERVCPDFADEIFEKHLKAYKFLTQFVAGKSVLEIGCGTGYGSAVLAEVALRVEATDYSAQAINFARRRYSRPNVLFSVMNADQRFRYADNAFDVVLSSEVFEHLHHQDFHLGEVSRVLRPNGLCFIATPDPETNPDPDTLEGQNQFHTTVNHFGELRELLNRHFDEVLIVEAKDPAREHAIAKRNERLSAGEVGLSPFKPFEVFGQQINTQELDNQCSFFCFATNCRAARDVGREFS